MRRFITVLCGGVAATIGLTSPAWADDDVLPVFRSRVICDTNGDGNFADTSGNVAIFDNGDVRIGIRHLFPNKTYRVVLGCIVGNKLVFSDQTTSPKGRLSALIPELGRSGPLAGGCALPTVNLFPVAGGAEFCYAGYGQP